MQDVLSCLLIGIATMHALGILGVGTRLSTL